MTAGLTMRAATRADIPAVAQLHRRSDTAWFGAPETDENETAEEFDLAGDLAANSRLLFDGDRLVGAALRFVTEAGLTVDPEADAAALYAQLLPWLAQSPVQLEVLDRDAARRAELEARNWTYRYSAFDLRRGYAGWTPPEPAWAEGVSARDYRPQDAAGVHHLVYVDAHWTDEPGHFPRPLDEWHRLFVAGRAHDELPILACRGDRIVGVAIGRTFSDGTGWINQLAVAEDERGHGIGTALMAAYFARRRAAGATSAGLGVMAANRGALRLYLGVGLEISREYLAYAPPTT